MKIQFNLNIKSPCSENFNTFSPTPNGGFCGSCEKEVIDFTTRNAQEIVNYFKTKSNKDTCGKFNQGQLKTYSLSVPQRKRFSLLSGIGLAILSFFSLQATAQGKVVKKQLETNGNPSEIKALKFQNTIVVKGNVSKDALPLPGVNILLEGTTTGTQTDFDGNFKFPIKLKKGDVLVFSYAGLESKKIIINDKDSVSKIDLKVDMKVSSCVLLGKVAVKKVYKSKRK